MQRPPGYVLDIASIDPPSLPPDISARLATLGVLLDPVRRALYLYVLAERRAVSRDEAAAAVDIRRGLAAFHLDRLADEGLVDIEYRRLTGRTGPGAGRPAKLYRAAERDHEMTLPPRSYSFVAELLAESVEAARPGGSGESAEEVARRRGRDLGQAITAAIGSRPRKADIQGAVDALLAELGYQPYADGRVRRLRNCPFHALADSHRDLVCGMNHALLAGVLDGAGVARLQARLDPRPGECCVALAPAASRARPTG